MLYVGTSGWSYKHWGKTFYPPGLVARDQLKFLARYFPTVELNASFYRLPADETFARWRDETPPDFRFSVKVSRIITHNKRLHNVAEDWQTFIDAASTLEDKLGIYLLQFPPSFKATPEAVGRLDEFLRFALASGIRLAGEFRHASWMEPAQLDLFTKHQFCLVAADSSRYAHSPEGFSPAPYAYFRLHGPRRLYASQYTDDELQHWADLIKVELGMGKDVYAYFDNDFQGYAIEDAQRLRTVLEPR